MPSSLLLLQKAISQKQTTQFLKEIKQHPEILLEKDAEGNTLLHFAAEHCQNQRIIKTMLALLLQLNKVKEVLSANNINGSTPLHLAVLHNTSKILRQMMNALGEEKKELVRVCDFERKTPLAQLENRKIPSNAERYKIFRLLENSTNHNTVEKLSHKVKHKEEHHSSDPRLQRNFDIAYDIINRVRGVITGSCSHPDINSIKPEIQFQIDKKLAALRELRRYDNLYASFEKFEKSAKKIENSHVGNCEEMVTYALYLMMKDHPTLSAFMGTIQNGDHDYLVFDVAHDANSHDYTTWGEYAMVADPWAGKVYRVADIVNQLEDYYYLNLYKKHMSLMMKFNNNFHKLKLEENPLQEKLNPRKRKLETTVAEVSDVKRLKQ